LPASSITAFMGVGKERDIHVLTKLSPFEDWGNFSYSIEVAKSK